MKILEWILFLKFFIMLMKDKNALTVMESDLEGLEAQKCDDFEYYHCNRCLKKCFGSIACATYAKDVNDDGKSVKKPVILVDDKFFKMSENCRRFIIAHEGGHLHHQHLEEKVDVRDRGRYIKKNTVMPMELEADAFAAQVVGFWPAIWALEEIREYLRKERGNAQAIKELNLRITAVRMMCGKCGSPMDPQQDK